MLANEQERLAHLEDWDERGVRTCFEVSFRRLVTPQLQTIFAQLAVFDGLDFSVDAIANIAAINSVQAKKALGRLSSLSLLDTSSSAAHLTVHDATEKNITLRYQLHTLLHLFAREKLGDALATSRQAAAAYYIDYAHRFGTANRNDWIDIDWANIASTMGWTLAHNDIPLLHRGVSGLTAIQPGSIGYLDASGEWHRARE